MKKSLSRVFWILIIGLFLVATISTVIVLVGKDKMPESLYSLLFEIDKALIVTVIIGTIVKLVSDDIYKVKKNDEKMRKIGIFQIGEGRLDNKQSNLMFGANGYEYPLELKFLFISGNNFTATFKKRMLDAMKHGCNIKYLIADPIKSAEYLSRHEALCPQPPHEGSYVDQVKETVNVIKEMQKEAKSNNYPGSIEVRHYIDEYQYNYRLAIYQKGDNQSIRLWANFQPQNKDAIELSLGVHGLFDEGFVKDATSRSSKESESIVLALDKSFDYLWEKYSPKKK